MTILYSAIFTWPQHRNWAKSILKSKKLKWICKAISHPMIFFWSLVISCFCTRQSDTDNSHALPSILQWSKLKIINIKLTIQLVQSRLGWIYDVSPLPPLLLKLLLPLIQVQIQIQIQMFQSRLGHIGDVASPPPPLSQPSFTPSFSSCLLQFLPCSQVVFVFIYFNSLFCDICIFEKQQFRNTSSTVLESKSLCLIDQSLIKNSPQGGGQDDWRLCPHLLQYSVI